MKTTAMTPELYEYVQKRCDLPHPVLADVERETLKLPYAQMQISRDQGAFMHMITKLLGVQRALEIGCFTGYSAICVASALPANGKLVSLDYNDEYVTMAKRFFAKAGLEKRIDVIVGPAINTLHLMKKEFGAGGFDMAFIDADKESLADYFEHCLYLVRTNGLILVDNVIWNGQVLNPSDDSPATRSVKAFNEKILSDKRVERVMLHIADGIFLLRKL